MYYQYFGLAEAPFSIAVNPRYLYMSPRHRDALAHLLYGVGAGGGFILLTGEVGTGKTTLNRCLIEQLPGNADVAIVLNPALDARDLLATVCEELRIDLPAGAPPGLKSLTDALHGFLLANHGRGRKTVLMIDEAQHLDFEVLEQIRLLTNLETHDEKLLHIILIGQPELAAKLARPELRQLNQRITARYDLQPLTLEETGAYIRHRLHVAGMPAGRELFSPSLVRAIHGYSNGVPRLINLLCDRTLLGTYGRGAERPDRGLLQRAAREVTGEFPGRRRWPLWVAGVAALFLVLVALWTMLRPAGVPRTSAPTPEASGAEPAPAVAAPVATVPATVSAVEWQLAPEQGLRLLGALYDLAPGANPCISPGAAGPRCERGEASTWDALLAPGRPVLLELADARRFAARALFLGIDAQAALLATERGVTPVPLAELAEAWTGGFRYYWQPPRGWQGAVGEGDSGPSVTAIAGFFARLDDQDRPLAKDRFTAALAQRVRLYQAGRGLTADGVVGEQTLRALVLDAGADLSRSAARERIAARVVAGQWP